MLETPPLGKYLTRWVSVLVALGNTWVLFKLYRQVGDAGMAQQVHMLDRHSWQQEFDPHELQENRIKLSLVLYTEDSGPLFRWKLPASQRPLTVLIVTRNRDTKKAGKQVPDGPSALKTLLPPTGLLILAGQPFSIVPVSVFLVIGFYL